MALFNNNKNTPIVIQLSAKSAELREQQAADADTAKAFIEAAADAQKSSERAAQDAEAVERAFAILDEAGVTL